MSKRIKILSPIDRIEEATPLIKAGADEFFCGVLIDGLNTSSPRGFKLESSNLLNLDELKKLVLVLKKYNKKTFLALNISKGEKKSFSVIEKNIEKIKNTNVDSIIIGNINLINELKNAGIDIIISSLLEVKNKEAVRLFVKEFGAKRVILDRQIIENDLKSITHEFPKIKIEAFIMQSGCRSLISSCRRHLAINKNIHLCLKSFFVDKKNKVKLLNSFDKEIIASRLKMPMPTCGACALFQFNKYNIDSVKIVGRGYLIEEKIKNIEIIKSSRGILEKNYSEEKFYQKVEDLFEKTFGYKCKRRFCYYPHFFKQK